MIELQQVGKALQKAGDAIIENDDSIDRAHEIFLKRLADEAQPSAIRRRTFRLIPAFATIAVISIIVAAAFLYWKPWQQEAQTASVDDWMRAPQDKPLRITFSDSDMIVLSPKTIARVVTRSKTKSAVILERGSAQVSVTHRPFKEWLLLAGPFEIHVTGTKFLLSWDPDISFIQVEMTEGEIIIHGPLVLGGQTVKAGQRFSAWLGEQRFEVKEQNTNLPSLEETAPPSEPNNDSVPVESIATNSKDDHASEKPVHSNNPNKSSKVESNEQIRSSPPWIEECRQGNVEEAVAFVESEGPSSTFAKAGPEDILALADGARLIGKVAIAEQAYLNLRHRFAGSGPATTAALALGRMAFDQMHDYQKSAHWLNVYLDEQQGTGLERETLGRLMEAQHRSGAPHTARETAQRYVDNYPTGPKAERAKEIMGIPPTD